MEHSNERIEVPESSSVGAEPVGLEFAKPHRLMLASPVGRKPRDSGVAEGLVITRPSIGRPAIPRISPRRNANEQP